MMIGEPNMKKSPFTPELQNKIDDCIRSGEALKKKAEYLADNTDTLHILMSEIQQFSDKTFGDPIERTCLGPLRKLEDELQELIEHPDDKMEWADCMLLLLDAARRKGITPNELFGYCLQKLEINKQRTWKKSEEGVFSHEK